MVGKPLAMIDIAAEKVLIAERNAQKIAVEVKNYDGTERGITEEWVMAGVLPEQIVLAFQPP
jgi:XisH protein